MKYDCTTRYEKMKDKLLKEYGTKHLCGECKYTTKCVRNIIQIGNDASKKRELMLKYAPFVTKFAIEHYSKTHRQTGFVAVYECDKFEFEGV